MNHRIRTTLRDMGSSLHVSRSSNTGYVGRWVFRVWVIMGRLYFGVTPCPFVGLSFDERWAISQSLIGRGFEDGKSVLY